MISILIFLPIISLVCDPNDVAYVLLKKYHRYKTLKSMLQLRFGVQKSRVFQNSSLNWSKLGSLIG